MSEIPGGRLLCAVQQKQLRNLCRKRIFVLIRFRGHKQPRSAFATPTTTTSTNKTPLSVPNEIESEIAKAQLSRTNCFLWRVCWLFCARRSVNIFGIFYQLDIAVFQPRCTWGEPPPKSRRHRGTALMAKEPNNRILRGLLGSTEA